MQICQQEKKTDKEKLFSRIRSEKVTLFIGSGFSLRAGAPSAKAIVTAIKDACKDIEKTDLKDAAEEYFLRNNEDRSKLIELVQGLFPQHAICDDNQKALTRIPHIKQIFTTNYDAYLEEAYGDKGHVIREDKDIANSSNDVVQIYKLHGDFVNKDAIVLTQDDYDDFFDYKKNNLIWEPLKLAMMRTHMVFIGYSLDDSNVFRILKYVEDIYGTPPHEMYMVAPEPEEYKAVRLKKHNVTWINSTAEDFLKELEQNIEDNIFRDFRSKKVSNETFIHYCNIHGINPAVQNNVNKNEVLQVDGFLGAKLDRKINLSISGGLLNKSFWDNIRPLGDQGLLKGRYGITIPVSNITAFECRINGLKELDKDDVSTLYIIIPAKERIVNIRIPNRNFIAPAKCEIRQVGYFEYKCTFDFDICTFIINVEKDTDNKKIIGGNVFIEAKDVYQSQSNALRWVEVIDAIASGEKVSFPELEGMEIQMGIKKENPFKIYKEYYEMVKTIELHSNVTFSKYYNFNQARYIEAMKLCYWLKEQVLIHQMPGDDDELDVEFHNDIENDDLYHIPHTYKLRMVMEQEIEPILFNDHIFKIPFDYICFEDCYIKNVEILPDGNTKLVLHNPSKTYKEFLTTTPKFQEEYNDLLYFKPEQIKS